MEKGPKRRHWWMYILIFFVSQLSAAIIPIVLSIVSQEPILNGEWTIVLTLLIANLLAIILFLLYRPQDVTWQSTWAGVQGRNGHRTGLVFLMAIPVIVIVNILQEALFPELPDWVGDETFKAIMYNPVGLLTVAILGPLSEELLFRGGVQGNLKKSFILYAALIFSVCHLNPAQMPAAFILGLLLGFAYWWTGSLMAPVCIHIFNNSSACVLAFLSPDNDSLIQFLGGPLEAGIAVTVSLLLFCLLVYRIRRK